MSNEDWLDNTRRWFRDQANGKLIVATIILLGIGYVVFGFGYDQKYHEQVNGELKLAAILCENSFDWVMADPKRLVMGRGDLHEVRVNGETIPLKHVKYPKVIFLDSGIRNINKSTTATEIYCVFKDPRTTSKQFFYKYDERIWVDKVRFRR